MKVYHEEKRCEVFQSGGKYICSGCWQEFATQPGPEQGVTYIPGEDEKALLIFTNGESTVSRLLTHEQAKALSALLIPVGLAGGWTWGYELNAGVAGALGIKFTAAEQRKLRLNELTWD